MKKGWGTQCLLLSLCNIRTFLPSCKTISVYLILEYRIYRLKLTLKYRLHKARKQNSTKINCLKFFTQKLRSSVCSYLYNTLCIYEKPKCKNCRSFHLKLNCEHVTSRYHRSTFFKSC